MPEDMTVGFGGRPESSPDERRRRLRTTLETIPRILIIRLRSLGDSILALPLVEALHAWRPDLEIDILSEAPYAGVFSHHPAIHETLSVNPRHRSGMAGWSRARACLEIRKRRYPAVVNLHGGTTSGIYTWMSGAGVRIGQQKYRYGWAYNALIPAPPAVWGRTDLHTVEDQLTLMPWLGLPVPAKPRGELHLDSGARSRVRERLNVSGVGTSGFVLIHPTATLQTKQWPEGKFAGLADRLWDRCSIPVIFTSRADEAQVLLNVGGQARFPHRFWSDLGLDDLFGLIAECRLFVGNDSGPTHAAAALGKPLVVIWGSSDFRVWHPWDSKYQTVRLELPCMPCPGYVCAEFGKPKCIQEVDVEEVWQACRRSLGA